jgi:hypothetical protein
MGLRFLKMLLIALLALVVGYATALGLGLVAFELFEVSQREGAAAMGLAFVISPFAAVISAIVAVIWYWIASAPRTATPHSTALPASRGRGPRVLVIVASVVAGGLGGSLLQWLFAGQSYEMFIVAFAMASAPWIGAIVLGLVAWWMTRHPQVVARQSE